MKNQILIKLILIFVLLFATEVLYAQTEPVDTEDTEDYEDFTNGQRWGTWALNHFVLPGLGSYIIMHDKVGGTTQLSMGIVSDALITTGYVYYIISGAYGYFNFSSFGYGDNYEKIDKQKMIIGFILLGAGEIVSTVKFIYNIIRSSTYHKSQSEITSLVDPTAWNIAVLPSRNGSIDKVQLSYTLRF
jgi:hypothetical protein